MTNRPTDDFENREQDNSIDYGDDDSAAFGTGSGTREETPVGEPLTLTEEAGEEGDDIANQYDDSDFVTDDAADVLEEDFAATDAEYTESDFDPLAEDADTYPNAEEIYDAPAGDKKQGLMGKLQDMKTGDKIFYGLGAVAGLGALYFAFAMTMGTSPAPVESMLTAEQQQEAATMPVLPTVNTQANAPIENPAEPKPDAIGVQGGQSTLNSDDTFAPLPQQPSMPQAVPDAPPAELTQQAAAPQIPVQAPQQVVEQPVAPAAPLPPLASQTPTTPEQAQLQAQLEAQQQSMQALQAQIEAQQQSMQALQAQREAEAKAKQLTAVTAPPSIVTSDNPALNQVATDLGVRIAELNARLTQISETLNTLQSTTTKLDQQSAELQNKTKALDDKVGTQSTKLTELANKEPAVTPSSLEQVKANLSQIESKVNNLSKQQVELKSAQDKARAAAAAAPVPTYTAPRPAPVASTPPQSMMPAQQQPQQQQNVLQRPAPQAQPQQQQAAAPIQPPRSPKARDLAGYNTPSQTAATNTWVLRAATPTMAWLSPRPGSAELKRVAPGDTVDGIGQVLEIKQEAGRWTVFGTAGAIR